MTHDLTAALRQHFGYSAFRPSQEQAVRHVLDGRDLLVVMPTGAGKSLVYQLPALLLPGTTLVVSPLVALMKDQVDALVAAGKRATFLNSSLDGDERDARAAGLVRGQYQLVYVAPERLRNRAFGQALAQARIARVAVDEAHCISQWGHDFRPDYLHLRAALEAIGRPPIVALTATATPQVQDDIIAQLGLRDAARLVTGFNRPNLTFEVHPAEDDDEKLRALVRLLEETPGSTIVYAGTRRKAEDVGAYLRGHGVTCEFYHAGLDMDARRRVQDTFMQGRVRAIVATNAFGMGVDKPDIRSVIHYSLPGTVEAYYQEAGRAGRDGLPSRAVLLYAPDDQNLQQWFIDHDAPDLVELQRLVGQLEDLASPAGQVRIGVTELAEAVKVHDVAVRVAISQLEAAGALRRLTDVARQMQLQLLPDARTVDLVAIHDETERRRDYKRAKLAQMVQYAEMRTCRRRFILTYFGDPGRPDAARCCDICLARAGRPVARPVPRRPAPRRPREDDDLLGDMLDPVDAWLRGNRRRRRGPRLDTVEHTLVLFDQGLSPAAIARARAMSERTIWGHLATLVGRGEVHVDRLVPRDVQTRIREAAARVGGGRLASIKAVLPGITYEQIRCVVAQMERGD